MIIDKPYFIRMEPTSFVLQTNSKYSRKKELTDFIKISDKIIN